MQPTSERRARLLHVDDDADWRTLVARTLGPLYTVDSVATIREAELLLQQTYYDLALIDQDLGDGRTGDEILALLTAHYPSTRRMVVTGHPLDGSAKSYVERYELDDVIFKGSHLADDLRAAVKSALARSPGGLPADVVNHKVDLGYKLRVEIKLIDARLREEIRERRERLRAVENVHPELRAAAVQDLEASQRRRSELVAAKARLQSLIDGIVNLAGATPVAAEIDRVLKYFDDERQS